MTISKIGNNENLILNKKSHPTAELFRKTLINEIFTLRKFLGSLLAMIIFPIGLIITMNIRANETSIFQPMSLGYVILIYNFSIVFPIIISSLTTPLISTEVNEGTMEILLSKPISRSNVILFKYFTVILFGIALSFFSMFFIGIAAYVRYPFNDTIPFCLMNFIFSILVLVFFTSLTMGISCLMNKPQNVILIPIILVVILFLVFIMIKPFLTVTLGETSKYEEYRLYIFDISYHFMNVCYFLYETFLVPIENNLFFTKNSKKLILYTNL